MRRRSLSASRAHGVGGVAERTALRSDHPLLRATEAVHYTGSQWVHVAAVLTGSAIASIEGREWAGPLAGSAAIVLLILTVLVASHKQRERDCAIELVLKGAKQFRSRLSSVSADGSSPSRLATASRAISRI